MEPAAMFLERGACEILLLFAATFFLSFIYVGRENVYESGPTLRIMSTNREGKGFAREYRPRT